MVNPLVLIFGTCSFIAAFLIHALVWRLIKPRRQLISLGIIFIILPLSAFVLASCFFVSKFQLFLAGLWHLSLSSAYIATYPVFQAECPSLKIILAVASSMPDGMTAGAISNLFSQDALLEDRLEDLVNDGLAFVKNSEYSISLKGRLVVMFFSAYRRLLDLPPGEG